MKLTTKLIAALTFVPVVATFQISAATVEIDPTGDLPASHSLVYEANWDNDGNTEGWAANGQTTFDVGTPLGGVIAGSSTGGDPNINRSGLSVTTSQTTIIEFAITRSATDASTINLFFADGAGGIAGTRRLDAPLTSTGSQQVVRITTNGEFTGDVTQFRFDYSTVNGTTFAIDYFRVYSVVPAVAIEWDPTQSGGAALGGTGTWDTIANNFWDGSSQVAWPATSTMEQSADFGGTAGTVTIDAGGIITNAFASIAGYTFTGGALSFDGIFPTADANTTIFDVPVSNSSMDTLTFTGDACSFSQPSTNTGDIALNMTRFNVFADDVFGTGTVATKTGNVFIAAGDETRSLANDFNWKGNRLVINSALAGGATGTAEALIINGDWAFNGETPSDIFLRRDLTINGVVSGSAGGTNALYFNGDSGILTLTNENNTYGGGNTNSIRFVNNSLLEVTSDGCLGDAANLFRFSGGAGGVFFLNDESFTRDIVLEGSNRGDLGTDGVLTIEAVEEAQTTVTTPATDGTPVLGTFGTGTINFNLPDLDLGRARLLAGSDFTNINAPMRGGLIADFGVITINDNFVTNNAGPSTLTWEVRGNAIINQEAGAVFGSFLTQIGTAGDAPNMATWNMNGGSFQNNGELLVGWTGPGTLNVNSGASLNINFLRANNDSLGAGNDEASVINFNGGTTLTRRLSGSGDPFAEGGALGTWVFNGGIIRTKTNPIVPFMYNLGTPLVSDGGAIIDSNGVDIEARVDFASDPEVVGVDGGLTKLGEGTLLLSGVNTYTGPTSVDIGCLVVTSADGIASTANTFVATGAGFGGLVSAGSLGDSDIQALVDEVNWSAGSSLVIDTNGENVTISADITGDIGLIKKGEGELTLTGNNTFTGAIEVQGGSITGFNPDASIAIDSIAKAGSNFTVAFTADGNVDVYRSSDLQSWGTALATDQPSPFTDNTASGAKFFYVLVPTGTPYPPVAN